MNASRKPAAERTLELHGIDCPEAFLRAKLVLEALEPGERLCVVVDNPLSKIDLPRSAKLHGYGVVEVAERGGGVWAITVQV